MAFYPSYLGPKLPPVLLVVDAPEILGAFTWTWSFPMRNGVLEFVSPQIYETEICELRKRCRNTTNMVFSWRILNLIHTVQWIAQVYHGWPLLAPGQLHPSGGRPADVCRVTCHMLCCMYRIMVTWIRYILYICRVYMYVYIYIHTYVYINSIYTVYIYIHICSMYNLHACMTGTYHHMLVYSRNYLNPGPY